MTGCHLLTNDRREPWFSYIKYDTSMVAHLIYELTSTEPFCLENTVFFINVTLEFTFCIGCVEQITISIKTLSYLVAFDGQVPHKHWKFFFRSLNLRWSILRPPWHLIMRWMEMSKLMGKRLAHPASLNWSLGAAMKNMNWSPWLQRSLKIPCSLLNSINNSQITRIR